jgi:hypothetical protein
MLASVDESARYNVLEDVNRRQNRNTNLRSYIISLPVINKPVVMKNSVPLKLINTRQAMYV